MIAIRAADFSGELLKLCPTVDSPTPSLEFERLWNERVNLPWHPGPENVLGLYGLNQHVAQTASGREGEKYASRALANMARLKARWTELPDESEWRALEREAEVEVPWLEALINRSQQDLEKLAPPTQVRSVFEEARLERFALGLPKRGRWKKVRDKTRSLSGLYPASFFHAARLLYDSKLRVTDRRESETKLPDCVYYLRRLEKRFEVRGWERALKLQREIIMRVTTKEKRS